MGEPGNSDQTRLWRGEAAGEFGRAGGECLSRHQHAYCVIAHRDGRMIGCNSAMAHLLGLDRLDPDEFRNEQIWDKLTESDGARLRERFKQTPAGDDPFLLNFVAANQIPQTLECGIALLPGGRFAMIGVSPQGSGDSEVTWLHLNNAFATLARENARKSKQLEVANSDLQATAEELRQSNQALAEARTAALQATQAKTDFLNHMSHEIRTPMHGVIGMVQLLLETGLSAEQRRYAEVAQRSSRALLALIDDILDLSKIEAGMIRIESLDFDLRRAVEDLTELWRMQANAKGLAWISRVAPDVPVLLRGDPNRLRQVLNNLVANAIKFTARGEVALQVDPVSEGDGKATVRFAVTDTGIGIRPDQAAALFAPFVQADVSTTREYGGTGLGLAISKQLVELMGGQIGIESREGAGSTFGFTVVCETARPETASASQPAPAAALRVPARAGRTARILVAEDVLTNRIVALAQLEKLGYQADAVANGADAVEALRNGEYDLVLMDCEMPTMDGYEATRRIREPGHPHIPIVAMTAHASPSDRDTCIRAGMDDFISKPWDLPHLAEVVAKWLPEPDPRGAVPTAEQSAPEQAAPEQATGVFDREALLKRLMGDKLLAGLLIQGFLQDFTAHLDALRGRLAEADGPGARLQAHALKGSAATVSAGGLWAVAREMELAAGTGDLNRFGELLPSTVKEFERFKSALEAAGSL